MLKIGIIGIAAVFFAVLLKRDRPELSMLLSVACGTIIFAFALERLGTTIEFFKGLLSKLPVEPAFFVTMVKMLGVALHRCWMHSESRSSHPGRQPMHSSEARGRG